MGAGRKTQTIITREKSLPHSTVNGIYTARNLRTRDLAAVIFGCTHSTIEDCFKFRLFGLPAAHHMYVKNICPGLPLFLFNFSDRKLHGVFEAASHGQLNINRQAWTTEEDSDCSPYAAQVKFRVRSPCQPLTEKQYGPVIAENYHAPKLFWFELDKDQTSKLVALFSSSPIIRMQTNPLEGSFGSDAREKQMFQSKIDYDGIRSRAPDTQMDLGCSGESCSTEGITLKNASPSFHVGGMGTYHMADQHSSWWKHSAYTDQKTHVLQLPMAEKNSENFLADVIDSRQEATDITSDQFSREWGMPHGSSSLDEEIQLSRAVPHGNVPGDEGLHDEKCCRLSLSETMENIVIAENNQQEQAAVLPTRESISDFHPVVTNLVQEVQELKSSQLMQIQRINILEQELIESRLEIQKLKGRGSILESGDLNTGELMLMAGGFDGSLWLSGLHSYSPLRDVMNPLASMSSVRSHASAAKFNGEFYVFGGKNGESWLDTVESYNPITNQWISRPLLCRKKGHLAGISLDNKIFAIGGGNGVDYLSEVELFDLCSGRWKLTRSMLDERMGPAAAELNGVLYVVGGYNRGGYLNSAERFDPREHAWTQLQNTNIKRVGHSLVVLNEKLYALAGYDGQKMVSLVEVYDPRVGSWTLDASMQHARGYFGAVVMKDVIYVMGGVDDSANLLDTVECFKDGCGWQTTSLKGIGKRCFFSTSLL